LKEKIIKTTLFLIIPLLITYIIFALQARNTKVKGIQTIALQSYYSSLPMEEQNDLQYLPLQEQIKPYPSDYRAFILDKYFAHYRSPLMGHGQDFVNSCNKWGAPRDCTTAAAIAYAESHLCEDAMSQKQFNCWGYGGSNDNRIWFKSYTSAIDEVTRRLVTYYGPKQMLKPELMEDVYCGKNCDLWGEAVQKARNEINYLAKSSGFPKLF
jgi:hypothetical protein